LSTETVLWGIHGGRPADADSLFFKEERDDYWLAEAE
jgi:hypothetical protein